MSGAGSLQKCERDIPRLDPGQGMEQFLAARQTLLGVQAPEPEQALEELDLVMAGAPPETGHFQSLNGILSRLWRTEREQGQCDDEIVYRLQKKFALFGRLAARYDQNLAKPDDCLAGPEELALFAALLLLRFSRNRSLNELNSALKLLDRALSEASPRGTLIAALVMERQALGKLIND